MQLLFFGLHQKSIYALDQKPVTKNPGATFVEVYVTTLAIPSCFVVDLAIPISPF